MKPFEIKRFFLYMRELEFGLDYGGIIMRTEEIKVSVIMPAYNGEKFIREAIQSIIDQTHTCWELFVIDDCSQDRTVEIIKEFNDERIHFIQNTKNMGIAYNTNLGIEKSSGKYIALLDDDDISMKDRLEIQVDFLEKHPEIDVLGGADLAIDENGEYIQCSGPPLRNPKLIKAYLLFEQNMFADCTVMYRRDFIEKNNIKYHEGCYGMHDMKFYMDASKKGTIKGIDEILIKRRIYKGQETQVQRRENGEQRARRFAELQRQSIKESGFDLDEKNLNAICNIVTEQYRDSYTFEELNDLYNAFKQIMLQAKEMDIDYLQELRYALTKILSDRLMPRMDIFSEDFVLGGNKNEKDSVI